MTKKKLVKEVKSVGKIGKVKRTYIVIGKTKTEENDVPRAIRGVE